MKISLNATYSDLRAIVEAPARPPNRPIGGFERNLDDALNSGSNTMELQGISSAGNEISLHAIEHMRASIRAPSMELRLMLPEPLEADSNQISPVNSTDSSVKTPTIVSAERVMSADPFFGLSRGEREGRVKELVRNAGERHGVDPLLSMAVIEVESSFQPLAVSRDGFESKGLMQLLDSTGRELHLDLGNGTESYRPFNPEENINLGVGYLRKLLDMFRAPTPVSDSLSTVAAENSSSQEKLALAAYNAGQGRVASAQERAQKAGANPSRYTDVEPYLPESTREYVSRIMAKMESREATFSG